MAPQELKFYILHDLSVMHVVSVLPRSKTAYFTISKNRRIFRLKKKNVIKGNRIVKLPVDVSDIVRQPEKNIGKF